MARRWLVALVLVGSALALPAAYKIYLVDGKVISADDKPVIRDGIAYFQKLGNEFYLPVDQVDLLKTEKSAAAAASVAAPEDVTTARPTGRKFGETELENISRTTRLANEAELIKPVVEGDEGGEGTEGGAAPKVDTQGGNAASGDRAALESQVTGLLNQRSQLQGQITGMQSQISSLRDRYSTSTSQSEKASLQSQIESAQSQLDSARSQLSTTEANLQNAQQRLSSMPVIVEKPR